MPPASSPPVSSRGYLTVLVATLLWSTTPVIIRYLIETQMPPLMVAFWRDALIAVALVIALSIIRPKLLHLPRRHVPYFILYGTVLMAFNATYAVSVSLNGASVSTVLAYSAPAFTALIGRWLWRESLGPFKVAAIILSLAGCVFISGAYTAQAWDINLAGIALGVLAGVLFAGYNIFGKAASLRGINPWTAVTYSFAFASLAFSLPLLLPLADWAPALGSIGGARDLWWLGRDWVGWGVLLALAWGPSLGGFSLYTVSLGLLPASVVSLIASLEPALTAGLAFLILGERLTAAQWTGAAMIVGGIMLLRADDLTRARLAPAA